MFYFLYFDDNLIQGYSSLFSALLVFFSLYANECYITSSIDDSSMNDVSVRFLLSHFLHLKHLLQVSFLFLCCDHFCLLCCEVFFVVCNDCFYYGFKAIFYVWFCCWFYLIPVLRGDFLHLLFYWSSESFLSATVLVSW